MLKIVSVVGITTITLLVSSCTLGGTENTQAPADSNAPVVQVDATTTGALSNPEFTKELNDVVNKSLEQAVNTAPATGSPDTTPVAPVDSNMMNPPPAPEAAVTPAPIAAPEATPAQ